MWWKVIGVLLLLMTFIVGLLVPLKSGIDQVSPFTANAGEQVTLNIEGYNSNYSEDSNTRVLLMMDSITALRGDVVEVTSAQQMSVRFDIPKVLPPGTLNTQTYSLIIEDDIDGAVVRPDALSITQVPLDSMVLDSAVMDSTLTDSTSFVDATYDAANFIKIDNFQTDSKFNFPYRPLLTETIRNTYFHVPMWFGMMILFLASVFYSVGFLRNQNERNDRVASSLVAVGVMFGILGLVTGAIWAKYAWGEWWSYDVKQNMSAVCMLVYAAYFVLRDSFEDMEKRARISAVYNIFAFVAMIALLFIIPRLVDSLHPGSGGNPGFGGEDLDNTMRMIFYPSIIGWTLIGLWIAQLLWRLKAVRHKLMER